MNQVSEQRNITVIVSGEICLNPQRLQSVHGVAAKAAIASGWSVLDSPEYCLEGSIVTINGADQVALSDPHAGISLMARVSGPGAFLDGNLDALSIQCTTRETAR